MYYFEYQLIEMRASCLGGLHGGNQYYAGGHERTTYELNLNYRNREEWPKE